jgi:hypothetical protein
MQRSIRYEQVERQVLAVLPDPVRIDHSDPAGRGGRDMREHR